MIKKILRIILIMLIPVVLFAGYMGYGFYNATKGMTPLETGKIDNRVYVIRDSIANMYFVRSGDSIIAVDAGNDRSVVAAECAKLGIDPKKVSAVFLTHTDGDHVSGLSLFSNAKVYISEQEESLLNGKTHRFFLFNNSIDAAYQKLRDGETITAGSIKVQAVLVPGHTPGSVSYIIDGKDIFTGDTLSLVKGDVALFSDFFNMDSKTEAVSIGKLKKLRGIERVFTAHNGMSSDFRKAFANWN